MARPLLVALLAGALALPVAAQSGDAALAGSQVADAPAPSAAGAPAADASRPDRYRIRVGRVGDQCVYHIRGADSQDAFTVAPGDRLQIQARGGLRAFFVFDDDGSVGAIRGFREVPLSEGASASRRVTVRDAIGRDTEHDVRILCCVPSGGRACATRQRAVARGADISARPAPMTGPPASGPSAADPAHLVPSDPLLGPRMQVKE